MSFYNDLELFFECSGTNYGYIFKNDVEEILRYKYLRYTRRTGKKNSNELYQQFLIDEVQHLILRGKRLYGDLEPEWGILYWYYEQEVMRVAIGTEFDPFRLSVLLDFVLELQKLD